MSSIIIFIWKRWCPAKCASSLLFHNDRRRGHWVLTYLMPQIGIAIEVTGDVKNKWWRIFIWILQTVKDNFERSTLGYFWSIEVYINSRWCIDQTIGISVFKALQSTCNSIADHITIRLRYGNWDCTIFWDKVISNHTKGIGDSDFSSIQRWDRQNIKIK